MPEPSPAQPGPTEREVVVVAAAGAVRAALASIDGEVVGVDVERADADRYFRSAALVQVGVADRCLLLDGMTLETMHDLDIFLDDTRVAVLHAAENDLDPLARKGVHPSRLADTAVAAALLGLPTGLSGLLAAVLGVELSVDKERFQRADWEARPLPGDMADYAAGDVFHLPALWRELAGRLEETGRTSWYEQELAFTLARADEDTRDWTRVKGTGRLDPAARAVVRALWEERERLAREHDTAEELVRRSPRRRGLLREHAAALLAASDRGRDAEPESRDDGAQRWAAEEKARYDAMRKARAEVAAGLSLDAGVVCSSRPLWRAVAGHPTDAHELCDLVGLRPWQADLLGEVLWAAYTNTAIPTADDTTAAGEDVAAAGEDATAPVEDAVS
jgi:ribonuclease D